MIKADRIIRDQAILRNKERENRRGYEINPPRGPGNTSVGSIYDCNRKHFERALKRYWDKLYVGWNPYKNDGIGCWEIWQQPSKKTPVLRYDDGDMAIWTTEYQPSDFEHWVADLPYLSYDFIGKLREMDAWENKQLAKTNDDKLEDYNTKKQHAEDENIRYVVKHNKQVFKDLLEYTQQGYDPTQFFTRRPK